MTVIASWGGGTSNAYLDITAADSILSTTVIDYSSWTDATTQKREAAVIQASRDVDSRQYIGVRYYFDQNLEFPRELRSDYPWNRTTVLGTITEDTEQERMQRRVEEATALQALWLLRNSGQNEHMENIAAGVSRKSEELGPIKESVSYKSGVKANKARFHPDAVALLSDYFTGRRIFRA